MAIVLENERGVKHDWSEAMSLYQTAADYGHLTYMVNLAVSYEHEEDLEQYTERAINLHQKSADGGDSDSQFNLALIFPDR